ncbi:acyl-CoA thioesterase [Myxococcota bacterium]|nr:acyl-CoA thioesterase [Myxococcota bacterium]
MRRVSPQETEAQQTHIVLPSHSNAHGNAFGGQIVAWTDICAAVSAQRFARRPVVTASIDELHFLQAVKVGMIVELRSMVNRAWNTSMEIGVRIEAEDPRTGARSHCCSAYLTFVALRDGDEAPKTPIVLPELDISASEIWLRRHHEAQLRRDHRLRTREERRGHR